MWCSLTTLSSLLVLSEGDLTSQHRLHCYYGLKMMWIDNAVITFITVWKLYSLTTLSSLVLRSEDDGALQNCHHFSYGLKMMWIDNAVTIFITV